MVGIVFFLLLGNRGLTAGVRARLLLLAAAAAAAAAMLMLLGPVWPGVEDRDTESAGAATLRRRERGGGADSRSKSGGRTTPGAVTPAAVEEAVATPGGGLMGCPFEAGLVIIPAADVSSEELEDPPRQSEELPEEPESLPGPPWEDLRRWAFQGATPTPPPTGGVVGMEAPLLMWGVVEEGVALDELLLLLVTPGMARRTMVGELSEEVVSGAELSMAAMP